MNRRKFIHSLSRTALVLPFADIVAIASPPPQQQQTQPQAKGIGPQERSYDAKAAPAPAGPKSPIEGTPLGVSFVDVVKESGLNEWADTNGIIVLYPQTVAMNASNPGGCWDWWGYLNDPNYAQKTGPQMQALSAMVARVAGLEAQWRHLRIFATPRKKASGRKR